MNSPELWLAPTADAAVTATVNVPGSKSVTNRALVLAALSNDQNLIHRPLLARDTRLMIAALEQLGIEFAETDHTILVTPSQLAGPAEIDCGLAGTVMRFMPPVAALASGSIRFDGDPRARVRPMAAVIDALRQLNVQVSDSGRGTLPFTIEAIGKVDGGKVEIDASASSQFVSALLLAAPKFKNGLELHHNGGPLPSLPHIDMTVDMLRQRGVAVDVEFENQYQASWRVHPGPIAAVKVKIEPDLSNALPFIAAAMATGGSVTIPDWPEHSTQPGAQIPVLMQLMGGICRLDHNGLTVHGPTELTGLDFDLSDVGELTPVIAALCALAVTPSNLRGIGHLRGHETDRLAALCTELNRAGGKVTESVDGLAIQPATLHSSVFETYEDHRMATAGAVLGLVVPGMQVVDIKTTSKTLPDFVGLWQRMLNA